jgi:cytochrome c551/c552
MKKILYSITSLLFIAFLNNSISTFDNRKLELMSVLQDGIMFPENIQVIIDAKCMNCHKPDARNEKAREKLQWEKVTAFSTEEQLHFINEMFEVLEEGKMPPAKSIERNPDMKLTDEETKSLLAWVITEEKRLKGK